MTATLPPAPSAPGSERRATPRYRVKPPLTCLVSLASGPVVCMALAEDVSASGLGLYVRRQFAPGEQIRVELNTPAASPRGLLPLRVAYVRERPEGGYGIGGALENSLSSQELQALTA